MTVRNRMNLLNQIPQVLKNVAALGQTRLLMLGGVILVQQIEGRSQAPVQQLVAPLMVVRDSSGPAPQ